jgi:hypothetical protein
MYYLMVAFNYSQSKPVNDASTETSLVGRCPVSPIIRADTLPLDETTKYVNEQWNKFIRNQASGGICKARHIKYRVTLACPAA